MRLIQLTQGKSAICSDWRYDTLIGLGPWYYEDKITSVRVYRTFIDELGKQRQITMATTIKGIAPDGFVWDHVNRNAFDNQDDNLRLATFSQNAHNRGIPRHNTTGYKGASLHKGGQDYQAYIGYNGRKIPLGRYVRVEEAALAYNFAAMWLHKEFACLNEVPCLGREIEEKVWNRVSSLLANLGDTFVQKNNTSGCTGVIYFKHNRKWQVLITFDGKRIFVGYYLTREAGTFAYIYSHIVLFRKPSPYKVPTNLSNEEKYQIKQRVNSYLKNHGFYPSLDLDDTGASSPPTKQTDTVLSDKDLVSLSQSDSHIELKQMEKMFSDLF